jgi:hypothetical protein
MFRLASKFRDLHIYVTIYIVIHSHTFYLEFQFNTYTVVHRSII